MQQFGGRVHDIDMNDCRGKAMEKEYLTKLVEVEQRSKKRKE